MATHKVRTTIRPLDEIEVGDEELLDLTRMGLLLDTKATTDDGLQKAADKQVMERAGSATPADDNEGQNV